MFYGGAVRLGLLGQEEGGEGCGYGVRVPAGWERSGR